MSFFVLSKNKPYSRILKLTPNLIVQSRYSQYAKSLCFKNKNIKKER